MIPFFVALAVALAIPISDLPAPLTKFTFRFAPSDGATWVETERQTKMTRSGAGLRRVVTQESKTRVTAHRIKGGWRLDHRVIKVKLKRDGRDESAMLAGLVGLEVALFTDAKGDLKRIEGLDKLMKAMSAGMPSLIGLALESLADPKVFEDQIRSEWSDRVSYFTGVQAEIGQYWVGSGKLASVHGPITYHSATKVTDRMPFQGASCVRLRFASHVDPNALAKVSPEAADKARANAVPQVGPRQVEYASEGERIVDPTTMMFRRERFFKTTKVWVELPLVGRTAMVSEEQTETTWKYE